MHAGDEKTIEFLTPTFGYLNEVEAVGDGSNLSVTHDGGQTPRSPVPRSVVAKVWLTRATCCSATRSTGF